MTRFCYMTRSIIHYVHDHDFETPWLLYVNRDYILLDLLISSSVANNSVCVRSILGDPGAVSGGGAKRARKKFGPRKVKQESKSP